MEDFKFFLINASEKRKCICNTQLVVWLKQNTITANCLTFSSFFQEELFYIETSSPPRITTQTKSFKEKLPPLGKMLLSVPVWALIITHAGHNWGMYTLLTEMPTYLSNIHHFNITSVRNAIIFLLLLICNTTILRSSLLPENGKNWKNNQTLAFFD